MRIMATTLVGKNNITELSLVTFRVVNPKVSRIIVLQHVKKTIFLVDFPVR